MKKSVLCRTLAVLSLCATMLMSQAFARYGAPDLQMVPIETLIANLEKKVGESASAKNLHHLARAHAMAFARRLAEGEAVEVKKGSESLWFGNEPGFVPYASPKKAAGGGEVPEAAREHLALAIGMYEKALKLTPEDATLLLGYGWCLEQSDKKEQAVQAYRTAIESFWKKEQALKSTHGPIGTHEAAGYLIPLLDGTKDVGEIAELKARVAKLEALPRLITPIAVALKPEMTLEEVVAPDAAVRFDADGSGRLDRWSWITPRAAWLVFDQQGDGQVTSAIQLFGNRTFMLFLKDGYEAMGLLDADGDGYLTGHELDHLSLWQDRNGDGVSDSGEVRSLASHGVVSFSIRPVLHATGILTCPDGVRFTDGSNAPTFDIILSRSNEGAKDIE